MNPTALTVEELVIVLKKHGSTHVDGEAITKDITLGAPTNEDGTINIIHYMAWMIRTHEDIYK